MSNTPQRSDQNMPSDVSDQALSVARTIDRICRVPGTYTITLEIPQPRRRPWSLKLAQMVVLRDTTTGRRR